MNDSLRNIIIKYQFGKIDEFEFIQNLPIEIKENNDKFKEFIGQVVEAKSSDDLDLAVRILYVLEKNDEFIDIIHKLILEPWHTLYEELVHNLQKRKNPKSIPFIKNAMQKRYKYLVSYDTGTRQFINQCGHALASIGTEEAINVIRELTLSDAPILRDEMLYRISRIDNTNNYERNYNIIDPFRVFL